MDGHLNINLNSFKLNKFRNTAPVWNFLPLVCLSPLTFNYPGIHLELHSQYFQNPVNFHCFQNYQCGTHHHSLLPGLLRQTPSQTSMSPPPGLCTSSLLFKDSLITVLSTPFFKSYSLMSFNICSNIPLWDLITLYNLIFLPHTSHSDLYFE